MTADPVEIIERAFDATQAQGAAAWLERMADVVVPALDPRWVVGVAFVVEPGPARNVVPVRRPGYRTHGDASLRLLRAARGLFDGQDRRTLEQRLAKPGLIRMADLGPLPTSLITRSALPIGDVILLTVPGTPHVVFAVATSERVSFDSCMARSWRRVAICLGAALSLAVVPSPHKELPRAAPELVPGGVERTSGSPGYLRGRIVTKERSQPPTMSERARAVELYAGLLSGAYSLVDDFERDGRRYTVARRHTSVRPALSRRQRQVAYFASLGLPNKQIGAVLGLAENTASAHLTRAMENIGVRSRMAFIRLSTQWVEAAACGAFEPTPPSKRADPRACSAEGPAGEQWVGEQWAVLPGRARA